MKISFNRYCEVYWKIYIVNLSIGSVDVVIDTRAGNRPIRLSSIEFLKSKVVSVPCYNKWKKMR